MFCCFFSLKSEKAVFIGGERSRSCSLLNLGVSHLWVGCVFTNNTCALLGTWPLDSQIFRGSRDHQSNAHLREDWPDCLTVLIRSPGWLCHKQVAGLWRADKKPAPLSSIPAPLPSHAVALDIRSICSQGGEERECLSEAALVVPLMSQHQFCGTAVGWGKRSQAVPDFDHPN